MDIPLAPEIEAIVHRKVAAGEYPSVAALVEEALFLLVERDWRASQADLVAQAPGVFELPHPNEPTAADHPDGTAP